MRRPGATRRTDLYLRANYPEIKTTIYRVDSSSFQIHCENYKADFLKFRTEFHNSIKPMTVPVEVVEKAPKEYIEVIPAIKDNEISKNFEGIFMSKSSLLNLLKSKFPNTTLYKVETTDAGEVSIYFQKYTVQNKNVKSYIFLNKQDRIKIEKFLKDLGTDINFKLVEVELEKEDQQLDKKDFINPVRNIISSNSNKKGTFDYERRDESLWFDKIDSIFESTFVKKDLYFFDEKEYSCYVDYSSFPNIDLRNHLFLYQTIFITPPYEKSIEQWLKESKIDKKEFLDLVDKRRIKVILTQPLSRYDITFINDVYNVSPDSVITRRALSCLQQIDLVEKSKNYIFKDVDTLGDIKSFTVAIEEKLGYNSRQLYNTIIWPIKALRNSFEVLNQSGLISTSVYGVNKIFQKNTSEYPNVDLDFEYTVNSPAIHLAHSLNATYFPFRAKDGYSDEYYASTMGKVLNFYKYATPHTVKSFVELDENIQSGIQTIDLIDMVEINEFISITELEDILSKDFIFPKSKNLIESLANLTEEERKIKVAYYNEEVSRLSKKRGKSDKTIDLTSNILLDAIGGATGLIGLGTAFSLSKLGLKTLAKEKSVKKISESITKSLNHNTDNQNIHYLNKISSVVKLKRK